MTGTITLAAAAFALVDVAAVLLLAKSPWVRRLAARAALVLLIGAGVVAALCMSAIVLAASANASTTPTVFVHTAAGSPDGTGSWAWAGKHSVPLVVRAEAPSAAASKLLRLELWDYVQTTGQDSRRYQVVSESCVAAYDVVFVVGDRCLSAVAV